MKRLYLILTVVGLVLPYYFFPSFLVTNGFDLRLLLGYLFANEISSFFAVDLIITALVLLLFVFRESKRLDMQSWWVYVIATLVVGPSFAFPLFIPARKSCRPLAGSR